MFGNFLFACVVVLSCAHAARVTLETSSLVSHHWRLVDMTQTDVNELIHLTFMIKNENVQKLFDFAATVSDPTHHHYRQFVSKDDVINLMQPTQNAVSSVMSHLRAHIKSARSTIVLSESKDYVKVACTVREAESLLQTRFNAYEHTQVSGVRVRKAPFYTVAEEIAPYIDFVAGVQRFPRVRLSQKETLLADARRMYDGFATRDDVASVASNFTVLLLPGDAAVSVIWTPVCADGTHVSSLGPNTCVSRTSLAWNDNAAPVDYVDTTADNCVMCSSLQSPSFLHRHCNTTVVGDYAVCHKQFAFPNFAIVSVLARTPPQTANAFNASSGPTIPLPWTTPQSLAREYDMPLGQQGGGGLSVAEFLDQYASVNDLQQFYSAFGLADESGSVQFIGPNNQSNPGGEASLDLQVVAAMAPNSTFVFWSLGGLYEGQEPFLNWTLQVQAATNPPLVHSLSYDDQESDLTVPYMKRLNIEFAKMAIRGLTLLFASGDDGVGGFHLRDNSSVCASRAQPTFPASSPFTTTIGGTQFDAGAQRVCANPRAAGGVGASGSVYGVLSVPCGGEISGEVVSSVRTGSRITSGGGFSDMNPMPTWQKVAVTKYLQTYTSKVPPASYFNSSGRAYPDVSGQASSSLIMIDGEWDSVAGTSASTPLLASMIARLNRILLENGQKPLGHVAPLLYYLASTNPEIFIDVTEGENACSVQLGSVTPKYNCCPYSYEAAPGWDASTGLGAVNYARLEKAVRALFHI